MTPEVMFHVSAGALGVISGAVTLIARKGESLHRRTGTVFFIVMLATAGSGAILGALKGEFANTIAGTLTSYFIATSWATVRQAERRVGWFEIGAMLFAFAGSAVAFYSAYDSVRNGTALLGGIPFYGFATVAATCALFDLSVVLRRGLAGRQRIARHLWRMCLGFFVAVGSFFPGQLQFFPDYIQHIRPIILLFIPAFSVIGVMLVWLAIVLFTRRYDTPRGVEA